MKFIGLKLSRSAMKRGVGDSIEFSAPTKTADIAVGITTKHLLGLKLSFGLPSRIIVLLLE